MPLCFFKDVYDDGPDVIQNVKVLIRSSIVIYVQLNNNFMPGFPFRFQPTNNDHIIEVQLYNRITFFCPYYEDSNIGAENAEHYVIYRVSAY